MKLNIFEDLKQIEINNSMFGMTLKVSLFFIDGLLIDTGPIRKQKQLTERLDRLPIEQLVLTHHHEDHSGLAFWIQAKKQIPIYCHPLGVKKGNAKERLPFYRRVFWGPKKPYQAQPLEETLKTNQYTFQVIHTPGHAEDHIALYNVEKGWLFGGDLFVQRQPKSMFSFESVPKLIQSLEKILTYDFDVYICSHVGIIPNGYQVIKEKLSYLRSLRDKVVTLHEQGLTDQAIRKKLFPKRHMMHYLSFFDNSPMYIIRSVLYER